ncbi:NupC/NupG family nucleoside CNT transporter [Akkermansiaceae bacterium]|jgi:CNT family concentrative nucleoside transporter|nr:NupC/NupG family nucleoside CNT transporter [Akkermansiaceae bacterium]MDA7898078.1 NupC/NupG family nucleoside CNT transporter [Akkermansiaceae bacterium]MDB4428697.1 NupC/NupG family nucleoside CNT transporter [Akkermansiaceae bacterium]MDB4450017.1 NupC/NupG family nucleoside CNT transporter [Akkermansiaceae bacterium]MDB4471153.1 NupC/NupG family nucleoside CNT transporter [Akkermansiaceae bacterium]
MSIIGVIFLLALGYLCSSNRKAISWRTVGGAFLIQVILAVFVLATPWGVKALQWLTMRVSDLIGAGEKGISFLFGPLSDGGGGVGWIFAFKVLPVIIFFSSLIAVLYHLRIMQMVILLVGGGLRKVLGTSRAESFSAAANIFVGQTEAPLVIRPYLPKMTSSELFAVMVGGLASIAGSVLAGYAGLGARMDHLIAACFMAAPGGLLFAKLIMPETEEVDDSRIELAEGEDQPVNVIDAAALGASSGLKLALNVGAMLLAFVGLIALANLFFGEVGGWFGDPQFSLEKLLGWFFAPVAYLLGVNGSEIQQAGSLIGQKLVMNEFIAFARFSEIKEGLSVKTQGIVTFALCGFANLSSIAILLGGLGVMAPGRRKEIAQLGLKAVFAATLANLMSAALAGLLL